MSYFMKFIIVVSHVQNFSCYELWVIKQDVALFEKVWMPVDCLQLLDYCNTQPTKNFITMINNLRVKMVLFKYKLPITSTGTCYIFSSWWIFLCTKLLTFYLLISIFCQTVKRTDTGESFTILSGVINAPDSSSMIKNCEALWLRKITIFIIAMFSICRI